MRHVTGPSISPMEPTPPRRRLTGRSASEDRFTSPGRDAAPDRGRLHMDARGPISPSRSSRNPSARSRAASPNTSRALQPATRRPVPHCEPAGYCCLRSPLRGPDRWVLERWPVDELRGILADPAGHKGVSQLVDALVAEAFGPALDPPHRQVHGCAGLCVRPRVGDVIRFRVLHSRPSDPARSPFARLGTSPPRTNRHLGYRCSTAQVVGSGSCAAHACLQQAEGIERRRCRLTTVMGDCFSLGGQRSSRVR
jgi:hypothetical protein